MRGLEAPLITEKERNKMRLILPHISRSFGVMQRIQTAELNVVCTLSALDSLPTGVLLLDGNGSVAFANRSALSMLDVGDGLRLRKLSPAAALGDLVADNAVACKAISEAIRTTLSRDPFVAPHFSKCVSVRQHSGTANFTLQFSALGEHNEFGTFAAIVFIADSAQQINIEPTLLQSAYGLTPAEAKVAAALLESSSVQEVAGVLGTSPLTVRTQIKHIYTKLGVDTRARFVKLLLGLATHNH
jgi:DNA-binding CsgD family transcriptional regulator